MPDEKSLAKKANSAPANRVLDLIASDKAKAQFAAALPRHIGADLFARIIITACNKTPKLVECTQESLFGSVMDLAQMGLVPDNRTAYLVPFWNNKKSCYECQYIVGYAGFIELAYRHPLVKGIRFREVYAKDQFDFEDGLNCSLKHVPCDEEDAGPIVKAWAVCDLEGGGKTFVVIGRREIAIAKSNSRDSDKPYSPWNKHEGAMWAKTAVRALAKRMPRSAELTTAIEADDKQAAPFHMEILPGGVGTPQLPGPGTTALDDAANAGSGGDGGSQGPESDNDGGDRTGGAGNGGNTGPMPTLKENRADVTNKLGAMNIGRTTFVKTLVAEKIIDRIVPFEDLTNETLQGVIDGWDDFKEKLMPK